MSGIKTVVVNKGDNLSKIARNNNTTVNDILKINTNINNPNLIYVGQEIIVPTEEVELNPTPKEEVTNIEVSEPIYESEPNPVKLQTMEKDLDNINNMKQNNGIPIEEIEEKIHKALEEKLNNPDNLEDALDKIRVSVDRFGGNGKYDILKDAKNSGNEEAYIKNMNNLIYNLEGANKKFLMDGKGYSFQSTVFSGGKHSTNNNKPTHKMGAKVDLRFYKNGVQLNTNNATPEDWIYIKSVLQVNNLGVQLEKRNTVWGDVFLNQALNKDGEYVSYEGTNWGTGINIYKA